MNLDELKRGRPTIEALPSRSELALADKPISALVFRIEEFGISDSQEEVGDLIRRSAPQLIEKDFP